MRAFATRCTAALGSFFLLACLVSANVLVILPAVCLAMILAARTGQEEKMMEAHFGEDYRRYQAQTGRLWPRITPRMRRD